MNANDNNKAFINPYTFVPLPSKIELGEPQGHRSLNAGNLSGTIDITWENLTPLLLEKSPSVDSSENMDQQQSWVVPGSSIKGAIRTVHEAMTASCLGVFDPEFRPVNRMAVDSAYPTLLSPLPADGLVGSDGDREGHTWTLARVTEVATDPDDPERTVIKRMRVSCDVVWVEVSEMFAAYPGIKNSSSDVTPTTGHRVKFQLVEKYVKKDRRREVRKVQITRERGRRRGNWYVMVSDAATRSDKRYRYSLGSVQGFERSVEPNVWHDFHRASYHAKDMDDARAGRLQANTVNVSQRCKTPDGVVHLRLGKRIALSGTFRKGDVFWVRCDAKDGAWQIGKISQSIVWRADGKTPAGERIGEQSEGISRGQCINPCRLCRTCQILGMIDHREHDVHAVPEQRSYASHVQFHSATVNAQNYRTLTLAPLRLPKPGFGAFYLKHDSREQIEATALRKEELPASRWGGRGDTVGNGQPREIRGRKFYWHADPQKAPFTPRSRGSASRSDGSLTLPRYEIHSGNEQKPKGRKGTRNNGDDRTKEPLEKATVIEEHVKFTSTVTFTNLTEAQLGSLLAAIQPDLLFQNIPENPPEQSSKRFRLHLGRGKPLGLGSVTTTITEVRAYTTSRYTSSARAERLIPQTLVTTYQQQAGDHERRAWQYLAQVLDLDAVLEEFVTYPIGASRDQILTSQYYEGFRFFRETDGSHGKPMQLLPTLAHKAKDATKDDHKLHLPVSSRNKGTHK